MNQSDDNIVLSICIPTRNRRDYLLKLVNECINIMDNRFEVIVSDNASDDGTEVAMRGIHSHKLHYIRHEENIGVYNILYCLIQGKGKFRLLIRDKDTIDHIPDFRVILDILQQTNANTTFFGTLTEANGTVMVPLREKTAKDSVGAYLSAMGNAYSSSIIFPGIVADNIVPKLKDNKDVAYLVSSYPHAVLLVGCAHNGDAVPMPELNIWFQKQGGLIYADTKNWPGTAQEPYWTIASRKILCLEWIRLFKEFRLPPELKGNILVNIMLRYVDFWASHAFNVIYFPPAGILKRAPEVIAAYRKRSITEWHSDFWDGFYSMSEEIASLYGISIVNREIMNVVKGCYNRFCQQTAAVERAKEEAN